MAMLDASNVDIINTVRANASLQYRDRVPVATQSNLAHTLSRIQEFDPFWNEFQSILINKIGLVVLDKNMVFENRLKPLKSGGMEFGGMVQELDAQLLRAQSYDPNATNVFDADAPEVLVNYHKINRRDKYVFKVNSDLLEEAFVTDGQLSAYVNSLMVLPQQSAEWDEYMLMLQLLGEYQNSDGGFANYQVTDVATALNPETAGKELTRKVREMYLTMKGFYNTKFNKQNADAFSTDLVLITTPKVQSYLDVDVLANAFNMNKAEWLADRVVIVQEWPAELSGTQCLLLDDKFYRVYDTKRRNVSIPNPSTLDWVYYYHVWQILSASKVKNALRFSTAADTITVGTTKTVSSISASVASNFYTPGDVVACGATVTYADSSTDGNAYFILSGATGSGTEEILPDSGTYIDRMGYLHISENASWTSITVRAVATLDQSVSDTETIALGPSIKLNKSTLTVTAAAGDSHTGSISATTIPAGETVTWHSSDTTKATVSNGTVTGVAAGTCEVTASFTKTGDRAGTYTSEPCVVTVS